MMAPFADNSWCEPVLKLAMIMEAALEQLVDAGHLDPERLVKDVVRAASRHDQDKAAEMDQYRKEHPGAAFLLDILKNRLEQP